jgi:hypothetical protein
MDSLPRSTEKKIFFQNTLFKMDSFAAKHCKKSPVSVFRNL